MYTVYNYRSIVKFNFRGDPGHKKKGLGAAQAHELINNVKEMMEQNVLQLCHPGQIGISSKSFHAEGFTGGESINSDLKI